jgi:uncharacterized pyridoxamine 5'-phosphate oxidase family protein
MSSFPSFPLIDATDHEILMHKEVHFGGSFSIMIDYYKDEENKGCMEEFSQERIELLSQIEENEGILLAKELLTEEELNLVKRAQEKYSHLKNIYELPFSSAHLIADLILSEDIDAVTEIEALCKHPESIPLLLQIVQEEELYLPLFPGYGYAPFHAIECLGNLQAKEAIIPIFETLSKTDFFGEEAIFSALFHIGNPAKEFLLQKMQNMPITKDNENAAIALSWFQEDPEISAACFQFLTPEIAQEKPRFFSQLLLSCSSPNEKEQKILKELSQLPIVPEECKEEIQWILRQNQKRAKI